MLKFIITIVYVFFYVMCNIKDSILSNLRKAIIIIMETIKRIYNAMCLLLKIRPELSDWYANKISQMIINVMAKILHYITDMVRIFVYDTTVIVPGLIFWLLAEENGSILINNDKIFSILTISFAIIAIHIAILMGLYSNAQVTQGFTKSEKEKLCRGTLYVSVLIILIAQRYIVLLYGEYYLPFVDISYILFFLSIILYNDTFVITAVLRKLTKDNSSTNDVV